jgi:hypothetical protein
MNMSKRLKECRTYSSVEPRSVCVSYRQYVNGFVRFSENGLFVYLDHTARNQDLFTIIGIDII